MHKPADCALCGRILPLGGVLDDVGRPVHLWCKGVQKRDTAHAAQETARKLRRGYRQMPLRQPTAI